MKKVKLSGKDAFKLYDTYGFPIELTKDILKEDGFEVDENGFKREMEIQKVRSRRDWQKKQLIKGE